MSGLRYGCAELEARLERLLPALGTRAGSPVLPPAERNACLEHLAGCPACRELAALAGLPAAANASDTSSATAAEVAGRAASPPDLLPRVLAATSGPACGRAEELLAGRLEAAPADPLLLEHLAGCPACRRLESTLAALARDLPALAEVAPDPAFVADILAATSGRAAAPMPRPVVDPLAAALDRVAAALARAWERGLRRPRFALEAAYALLLGLLVLGAPVASVAEPARELGRAIAVEPPELLGRLDEPAATAWTAELAATAGEAAAEIERLAAAFGDRAALLPELLAAAGDATAEAGRGILDAVAGDAERTFRAGRASQSSNADGDPTPPESPDDPEQETP